MSEDSKYDLVQVIALIASVVMVVSAFLPWCDGGQLGYDTGIGFGFGGLLAIGLGVLCFVFAGITNRYSLFSGLAIILLSFKYFGTCSDVSKVFLSYGVDSYSAGYGLYILLLVGVCYCVLTFKWLLAKK